MSLNNKTLGLILTLVGLVIAIIGVVLLVLDSIDIDDIVAYALIAVGAIVLVLGVLVMYVLKNELFGGPAKEKKAPAAKAAPKSSSSGSSGKSRAGSVNLGDTPLANAIKYGAQKVDSKVAEGKINDAQADAFIGRLMAYADKVGTNEEDAAMISVSQIIGVIASA